MFAVIDRDNLTGVSGSTNLDPSQPGVLRFTGDETPARAVDILKTHPLALRDVPEALKTQEVVYTALIQDARAREFVNEETLAAFDQHRIEAEEVFKLHNLLDYLETENLPAGASDRDWRRAMSKAENLSKQAGSLSQTDLAWMLVGRGMNPDLRTEEKKPNCYFRADRAMMLDMIASYPKATSFADDNLKKDRKFMLEAISSDAKAILYADESLIKDREFRLAAMEKNPNVCLYIQFFEEGDELSLESFIFAALEKAPKVWDYLPFSVKSKEAFVLKMLDNDKIAVRYIDLPLNIQENPRIAMKAMRLNKCSYEDLIANPLSENRAFIVSLLQSGINIYPDMKRTYDPLAEDLAIAKLAFERHPSLRETYDMPEASSIKEQVTQSLG